MATYAAMTSGVFPKVSLSPLETPSAVLPTWGVLQDEIVRRCAERGVPPSGLLAAKPYGLNRAVWSLFSRW